MKYYNDWRTKAAENVANDANNEVDNFEVFNYKKKVVDYANIRATDIPTVQRLFPPKPASMRREIIIQNIKDKMHANSALSNQCKRSVHTQEVLRNLLNSSSRLDWSTEVAPVIAEYMGRIWRKI